MEGPNEAGQVLDRKTFAAPFAEGALDLAFEVDDHEVLAGVKKLAQVDTAVAADFHGDHSPLEQPAKRSWSTDSCCKARSAPFCAASGSSESLFPSWSSARNDLVRTDW